MITDENNFKIKRKRKNNEFVLHESFGRKRETVSILDVSQCF